MKQLVIGLGEVGSAIQRILQCDGYDSRDGMKAPEGSFDVLHICFPYSLSFVADVSQYKSYFNAETIVVHSSVPVGTCDEHGWIHSPVRGVHPNLEQGIRTFVKYFGGVGALEAAKVFDNLGINTVVTVEARTTEALKLWDTTQYGVMIMLEKSIYEYCRQQGLDSELIYEHANRTYNLGYTRLGMEHVVRPHLKHMDGEIGGHCVIPNAHLLASPIAEMLIEFNENLKKSPQ